MKRWVLTALAVGMATVCFAEVRAIGFDPQGLYVAGSIADGAFVIDGTVAEVEEFLSVRALDPTLSSHVQDFIAKVLERLEAAAPDTSILIQPLGKIDANLDSMDDSLLCDAYINQDHPDTNYGGEGAVSVGCYYDYTAFGNREDRGLWGYYSCPSNSSYIIDADMWVYVQTSYVGTNRTFCVWRIGSSWSEYSVTWNTQPSYYNADCGTYYASSTGWVSFPAYLPVHAVCDNGYTNHGLALRGDTGWATSSTCPCWPWPLDDNEYIAITSYEGDSSKVAYVAIQYYSVELSDFRVEARSDTVAIAWRTSWEADNAGWNLYRSAGGGEYVKLNDSFIKPYQYDYEYVDADVEAGVRYCYKLEAVDLDGSTQTFGPECVDFGSSSGDGDSTDIPDVGSDDDADALSASGGCGWL